MPPETGTMPERDVNEATAALQQLLARAQAPDVALRRQAMETVGTIRGPASRWTSAHRATVTSAIGAALRDPDFGVRERAAHAANRLTLIDAVPALLGALAADDLRTGAGPKVAVETAGRRVGEYSLDKERTLVGSAPQADVRFDDPALQAEHALIVTILDDSFVEDLGTAQKRYLEDGACIQIGAHTLRYLRNEVTPVRSCLVAVNMAVNGLARYMTGPDLGRLIALAGHEGRYASQFALACLRERHGSWIADTVQRVMTDERLRERARAYAFVPAPDGACPISAVFAALDDAEEPLRIAAAWFLWQRARVGETDWIAQGLVDARANLRRVAATFAGRLRLAATQPRLTALLADPDARVRAAAARAISILASPGQAHQGGSRGWLSFTTPPRNSDP